MNEDIRDKISWTTIDKLFYDNKNFLVRHHLDSYNDFFENGIRGIFKNKNPFLDLILDNLGHFEPTLSFL